MLYPDTVRAVCTDPVKRMLGLHNAFIEANRERAPSAQSARARRSAG
jgi:hypothetical protein